MERGSGRDSVKTHFPKEPNCDICLKTQITRASRIRRAGTVVPRADIFGDLITADHKILTEESESHKQSSIEPLWYKIWQLSGYNPTRVKQKLPRRPRIAQWSSWSRRGSKTSFILTIPYTLASLLKNYPGIIVRQRHTDQKQMGLLREQCVEWKKGHLRYWLSAKHSRSLVWCQDTIWKAVRNALWRTSNTDRSNGQTSPYFCERPIWTASVWLTSLAR